MDTPSRSGTAKAWAPVLLIGSMVSVTVGASVAKNLFVEFGAAGTTFLRLFIAALILGFVARTWRARLRRPQWIAIAQYGICLGTMNLFFYQAIARLPIGIAIAIEFLGPLAVSLYYSRTKLDFLWIAFALLGVALLLPVAEATAALDTLGIVFALIAAVLWALYIIIGKRASAAAPSSMVAALGLMFGTLVALPFGVSAVSGLVAHPTLIGSAIAVGLLSSAIPYSLEMIALKKMESKNFGILLSLEPAIGALAAYVFIRENLTALQLIAIASVIVASIGSTVTSGRRGLKKKLKSEIAAP